MSIRRISDLPYLTEEQQDTTNANSKNNLMKSQIEISYFDNSEKSTETTYLSRCIEINQLTGIILADIVNNNVNFSGTKVFNSNTKFPMGIDVGTQITLSGDLHMNDTTPYNRLSAMMRFGTIDITSNNPVKIHNSATVDITDESDDKSVVNVEFLRRWIDQMEANINTRLDQIKASTQNVDYGTIWPVGSVFITTSQTTTCPIASLIPGSVWSKVEGRYLLTSGKLTGTEENYVAGNSVDAGAPNVSVSTTVWGSGRDDGGQYFSFGNSASSTHKITCKSSKDAIYGKSNTIRPPATVVDVWKRTR